jgi:hypothetical protein
MVIAASALRAHAAWLARGSSGEGRLTARGEDARAQDLRSAPLSGALLAGCNLAGAMLDGTTWASASVAGSSFREAVFGDANLDDASFVECDLRDADFSVLAAARTPDGRGTTARCRFERCDLRGSVWLDRDLAGARFVDCQLDLTCGRPREVAGVEIERPRLSNPDGAERAAAAAEIFALWGIGQVQPTLTDEDKAFIHRGLKGRWRKREAYLARGTREPPRTGVGSIADKWSEPFLPDVASSPASGTPLEAEPGEPVTLPAGTAAGVVVRRGASGVAVYRDPRSGFALALPSPVFLAPSPDLDATAEVGGAVLHICRLPRAPGVRPADEVAGRVREITGAAPAALELTRPGVSAAATATARQGELVREVAAIAGGAGDEAAVMRLMFDHSSDALDAVAALTVWSAVLGSASFGPARGGLPALVPPSPWWEPGLPPRLAASRPSLPEVERARELAVELLALTELSPPTQPLDEVVRGEIARRLTGAGLGDAPRITQTLATIHDLRGLAVALTSADAVR